MINQFFSLFKLRANSVVFFQLRNHITYESPKTTTSEDFLTQRPELRTAWFQLFADPFHKTSSSALMFKEKIGRQGNRHHTPSEINSRSFNGSEEIADRSKVVVWYEDLGTEASSQYHYR